MKFTITINQAGIADSGLAEHTDMIDWAILEYIKDWSMNPKAARIGNKVWINYSHLCKSMPLLGIKTKGPISRRISKLRELGLITTEKDPDGNLYAAPTERYNEVCRKVPSPDEIGEQI